MTYEKNGLWVDEDHLAAFAENCARSLRPDSTGRAQTAADALRNDLRELEALHDALALKWSGIRPMPAAAAA